MKEIGDNVLDRMTTKGLIDDTNLFVQYLRGENTIREPFDQVKKMS